MVRLTITNGMVKAILECHATWGEDFILEGAEDGPSLKAPTLGNPITHWQIVAISKQLLKEYNGSRRPTNNSEECSFHLDELLRGSKIYVDPPAPKPEKTSEYKALMARLRKEEEARSYERMTQAPSTLSLQPSSLAGADLEEDEVTYSDVDRQMSVIINVLVSIIACSFAIWIAASHWSVPSRLGLSMGGSGLVGIAEVVVYSGYLRRIGEAKQTEKKKIERKEIIDTWVIGGKDMKSSSGTETLVPLKRVESTNVRRRNLGAKS